MLFRSNALFGLGEGSSSLTPKEAVWSLSRQSFFRFSSAGFLSLGNPAVILTYVPVILSLSWGPLSSITPIEGVLYARSGRALLGVSFSLYSRSYTGFSRPSPTRRSFLFFRAIFLRISGAGRVSRISSDAALFSGGLRSKEADLCPLGSLRGPDASLVRFASLSPPPCFWGCFDPCSDDHRNPPPARFVLRVLVGRGELRGAFPGKALNQIRYFPFPRCSFLPEFGSLVFFPLSLGGCHRVPSVFGALPLPYRVIWPLSPGGRTALEFEPAIKWPGCLLFFL